MARDKTLKCPKCSRKFSMPAHLGRHVASTHGGGKRKAGGFRKGPRKKVRPGALATWAIPGFDPARLSLTQLCQVIDVARAEAGRRLEQL